MKDLGALVSHAEIPDLSPKTDADFEWWFLQGWIEGEHVARTHVMVSVFHVGGVGPDVPRGAMMIQHSLTPSTGKSWTDSRITPATRVAYSSVAEQYLARLPRPVRGIALQRHLQDTATWARVSGIAIDPRGPQFEADPFSLTWNGVSLVQVGEMLRTGMKLEGNRVLGLDLTPTTRWLNERSVGLNPDLSDHFFYISCPRLTATGSLDGAPITGQFWFDRQWGYYNDWILKGETGHSRVNGWHWFGLNLEDGRDLLLFHELDPTSQAPRFASGVLFEEGVPRSVGWRPGRVHRHWTSPQSQARYPIEWDISLPDLGIEARVVPVHDAQEIPIYGSTAIWEGAVVVTGSQRGREIGGTGRLELVGYGTPTTLQEFARRTVGKLTQGFLPSRPW